MKHAAVNAILRGRRLKPLLAPLLGGLCCLLALSSTAQNIPLGTWRLHLDHSSSQEVILASGQVYVRSDAGLYRASLGSLELEELSKSDGLSSLELSALGYDPSSFTLLFGYTDGTIDLIQEGEISPFLQIARSQLSGSKRIRRLVASNGTAYAVGDFGVAVIDLNSGLLRESYTNLGPSGTRLSVSDLVQQGDSLFLATDDGVLAARADGRVNLIDFNNWQRFGDTEGLPAFSPSAHVASWLGHIYAAISGEGLYRFNGQRWELFALAGATILDLETSLEQLWVTTSSGIRAFDEQGNATMPDSQDLSAPRDLALEGEVLWVADADRGLIRIADGSAQRLLPDGPSRNDINRLAFANEQLLGLSRGLSPDFSVFEGGSWRQVSTSTSRLQAAAYQATNAQWVLATATDGLLTWQGGTAFGSLDADTPGSTFLPVAGVVNAEEVVVDLQGNIWTVAGQELHKIDPSGAFEVFVPGFSLQGVSSMLAYSTGDIYVNRAVGFLGVYNESGAQALLRNEENAGGLAGSQVNDLVEDRRGRVWVAGDRGVAFFAFPGATLSDQPLDAIKPVFENQFLLLNEHINALASDGGNRKWIGTNNGLFLFEDDGTEQVFRFNESNSPLISNRILDLAIDPQSGEVFIATDRGLQSFRSDATAAQALHSTVEVYPNPVPLNFDGQVGIRGLAQDAIVKITDVSGQLVFETRANGGTASWSGRDYNGNRLAIGVYLVFSASEDGTEAYVGKVAITN